MGADETAAGKETLRDAVAASMAGAESEDASDLASDVIIIRPEDTDEGYEEPSAESGDELAEPEPTPEARPAEELFLRMDGKLFPAVRGADGDLEPGPEMRAYIDGKYMPRDEHVQALREAERFHGPRKEGPDEPQALSLDQKIEQILDKENPFDEEVQTADYKKFERQRQLDIARTTREDYEGRLAEIREQAQMAEIEAENARLSSRFDREFESLASAVGLPKGDAPQVKGLRAAIAEAVAREPILSGYNDDVAKGLNIPPSEMRSFDKVLRQKWAPIQAYIDYRISEGVKAAEAKAKDATPAPHRGGSPGMPAPAREPEPKIGSVPRSKAILGIASRMARRRASGA